MVVSRGEGEARRGGMSQGHGGASRIELERVVVGLLLRGRGGVGCVEVERVMVEVLSRDSDGPVVSIICLSTGFGVAVRRIGDSKEIVGKKLRFLLSKKT